MRFATFNIRTGLGFDLGHSWPFRRASTVDAIFGLEADVVGLQEVREFQRRYLDSQIPDLRWFGEGREGGLSGEQCPVVLASSALDIISSRTQWYGSSPLTKGRLPDASAPRVATLVRLRTHDGVDIDAVNTHLDERHSVNRETSVRQLVDWMIPDTPTVVMGDFNAEPGDAALGPLLAAGYQLVAVEGPTAHGFVGVGGTTIDHIFVSRHWAIEGSGVVREFPRGRLPSDHWPVWVDARLG